jgi:hypothetical protein
MRNASESHWPRYSVIYLKKIGAEKELFSKYGLFTPLALWNGLPFCPKSRF